MISITPVPSYPKRGTNVDKLGRKGPPLKIRGGLGGDMIFRLKLQ